MAQFEAEEIGQRIAQARKEAGLRNQDELADLLGVSMRMVQNYEAGVTIPYRHFQRLEAITGRPLAWFLQGDDTSRAEAGDVGEILGEVRGLRMEVGELRQEIEERLPPQQDEQAGDGRG